MANESYLETAFLDTVLSNDTSAWFTSIDLNERKTAFKLDTGAEVTAISKITHQSLGEPQLAIPEKRLYGPSQQPLNVIGQFWGTFAHKNKRVKQLTFVIDGLKTNLLGLPAIKAMDLVSRVDATIDSKSLIIDNFPSVFQGLGNLGEEYEIRLKPGASPHALFTPRHVPLPLRSKVQEELDRMESIGVILKVDEPTSTRCAGTVVMPKKEGAIRICVDLKPLNENVLREVHPLPKVDETLAQMSLDANSGFWQIPLARSQDSSLPSLLHPDGIALTKCPLAYQAPLNTFRKGLVKFSWAYKEFCA